MMGQSSSHSLASASVARPPMANDAYGDPARYEYTPTALHQLQTRTLLLRLLPAELALDILDLARYHHRSTSVSTTQYMDIAQRKVVYLWAEIRDPRKGARLEEVRVGTNSRDQGWSDEQGRYRGTYDASYSFFELLIAPTSKVEFNRYPPASEIHHSQHLQYNLHAISTVKTHLNTYTRPDFPFHAPVRTTSPFNSNAEDGGEVGAGEHKIDLITAATTAACSTPTIEPMSICVVAGAHFPGWQNRVSGARIECYYSYYHPHSSSRASLAA